MAEGGPQTPLPRSHPITKLLSPPFPAAHPRGVPSVPHFHGKGFPLPTPGPHPGCFYQEGTGCSRSSLSPTSLLPLSSPPPFRQPSAFTSSPPRCFNPFFVKRGFFLFLLISFLFLQRCG